MSLINELNTISESTFNVLLNTTNNLSIFFERVKHNEQSVILNLMKTVMFAAEAHSDQRRKNKFKTPYINHPIGVANLIVSVGKVYDLATIQGGLLHDTVEDTPVTLDQIEENFGKKLRQIVADVSDDKSLHKVERKKLQIEHASSACFEAKIVKLADKLHNLTSFFEEGGRPEGWSDEVVRGYFIWSSEVVNALHGTNVFLEEELNKLFAKDFNGERLVPENSEEKFLLLNQYYELIE
jgi:guanosine-3',5'-bis(diphosphate) 3'-pyrophosphohydrolase